MVKQLGWLMSASILFVLIVALEGWPALRDLSSNREWNTVEASPDGASMSGMQIVVEEQIAAIATQKPERAAVLVRLKMQVTPAAREAWKDCQVSLLGSAGQIWMPLTSASTDGAVKLLTPDHKNSGLCRLFPRNEPAGNETVRADQLFLLPSDSLQGLRLHVSGMGIRPQALSFAITPAIRQLP